MSCKRDELICQMDGRPASEHDAWEDGDDHGPWLTRRQMARRAARATPATPSHPDAPRDPREET